jgi:hypothetical protein
MTKEEIIQANSWLTPFQITELLKLDTWVEFIDAFSNMYHLRAEELAFIKMSEALTNKENIETLVEVSNMMNCVTKRTNNNDNLDIWI